MFGCLYSANSKQGINNKRALRCTGVKSSYCLFVVLLFGLASLIPSPSLSESLSETIQQFVSGDADTIFVLDYPQKTLLSFGDEQFLLVQGEPSQHSPTQLENAVVSYGSFDDGVMWARSFPWLNSFQLTSSEKSDSKVLVGYVIEEGRTVTEIFNASGKRLAKIEERALLRAAPDGSYFYTRPAIVVYNPLNVYDSLGNQLWSRKTVGDFWEVSALSNQSLLYADGENLLVLDAVTGQVKVEIQGGVYNKDIEPFGKFSTSRNGEYFVLYCSKAVFSFHQNGKLLWRHAVGKEEETATDMALSPDGRFLGVQFLLKNQSDYRLLRLYDNFDKGKVLSEIRFNADRSYTGAPISSVSVNGNFITVVLPSSYDLYYRSGVTAKTLTKCFDLKLDRGVIGDTVTVKGMLHSAKLKAGELKLYQVKRGTSGKLVLTRAK